jgi:hypothetical protein
LFSPLAPPLLLLLPTFFFMFIFYLLLFFCLPSRVFPLCICYQVINFALCLIFCEPITLVQLDIFSQFMNPNRRRADDIDRDIDGHTEAFSGFRYEQTQQQESELATEDEEGARRTRAMNATTRKTRKMMKVAMTLGLK